MSQMILDVGKRKRKAYWVSVVIAWSYVRLFAVKRWVSKSYFDRRLASLHKRNAMRLKTALLELNGLFIKVGQLLSTMSKILPHEYGATLEELQDKTPSSSYEVVKKEVEQALGNKFEHLFSAFSPVPIASASIGQVHEATTVLGQKVAVKIKHPYIDKLADVDLAIVENIITTYARLLGVKGMDDAFAQVRLMIEEELDYTIEADAMKAIGENCRNIKGVYIPEVLSEYSCERIITTNFCKGSKITNVQQLKEWGISPDEISQNLVYLFCEMILNHGVYHADPHPGNLLVNQRGDIILLDFGAVGKLDKKMHENIPPLIQAIVMRNQEDILAVLKKMGFISHNKGAEETAQKLIDLSTDFLQNGIDYQNFDINDLSVSDLMPFFKSLSISEMSSTLEVPKDWFLLQRTILLVQSITWDIAEDYNPMQTLKPYLQRFVFRNGNLKRLLLDVVTSQANYAISLPRKVNTFLEKANRGKLSYEISNLDKNTRKISLTIQQLMFGLLAMASFIMAFFSKANEYADYEQGFLIAGSIASVLMLVLWWKSSRN